MTVPIKPCPRAQNCSAPLCPLDIESLENGMWFSTEEICKFQEVNKIQFVKTQRKIAKRTKNKNPDNVGFFTYKMLNRNIRVYSSIKGLNPDSQEETQFQRIERWSKKHPPIRKYSKEEKEKFRARFQKRH